MNLEERRYEVNYSPLSRAGWVIVGVAVMLIASIPWIPGIRYGADYPLGGYLFATGLSGLFYVVAFGVTWSGLARRRLEYVDDDLVRVSSVGPVRWSHRIPNIRCVMWVRKWHYGKYHMRSAVDTIYVRSGVAGQWHLLADATTCSDLAELYLWLGNSKQVKTLDARDREAVGDSLYHALLKQNSKKD